MSRAPERLPIGPLWRQAELAWGVPAQGNRSKGTEAEAVFSASVLAVMCGTTARNVQRWKRDGVPVLWAERAAHTLGLTLHDLWPGRVADGDTDWKAAANCRGADPELFFPGRGDLDGLAAAKAVCAGCAVTGPCLAYALEHGEPGVWGGTSERERRRMRRAAS